jgi:hypothetical protein
LQLDNTRISVSERTLLDTFDLALRVIRHELWSLLRSFAVGALPLFAMNYVLIGWMMDRERATFFYVDDVGLISRYIWNMALMVTIEAPLASLFTTAYLGQAMFVEKPSWKSIGRDVMQMFPRILWSQVITRGVLAVWLLTWSLDRYSDFDSTIEIVGMGALAMYVLGVRSWRPFITEIILLEQNPLSSRNENAITVSRRSAQLHAPSAGDLLFRGIGSAFLAVFLTLSVFGTFVFLSGVLLNHWQPGPRMIGFVLPLAMWIVAGFMTVVRFLSYLDLRIRHEGWEVELLMRAEANRLRNRLA